MLSVALDIARVRGLLFLLLCTNIHLRFVGLYTLLLMSCYPLLHGPALQRHRAHPITYLTRPCPCIPPPPRLVALLGCAALWWCYPTGRCAYLASVTCYRQSIKPLLFLLLLPPCTGPFGAGAGRCSPPGTPCMCSFGAGASRCSPPRYSLHVLLWRWCEQMLAPPHSLHVLLSRADSPSRTPCMCSFGAGAGRCSPPRTPCMCSFGAGAADARPPGILCMCSFGAGASRCSPPRYSLHVLLWRWCGQTLRGFLVGLHSASPRPAA